MKRFSKTAGFTMTELLFAAVIMVVVLAGILLIYMRCLELSELSRSASIAVQAVKSRMELIRDTTFNLVIPCGLAAGNKGKFENRRFSR